MSAAVQTVKLTDVAELNPTLAAELTAASPVSFVPMSSVSAETARVEMEEERRYEEVSKGYTPFLNGDLLIAKITPCFENGKIAQATLTQRIGFGSTEFHVVRPRSEVLDARYLLHVLRQDRIRREGELKMTGSGGQRRIPEYFLAGLEIPLPPLPEQRRIAEVLDRAEALRAKRIKTLAQLNALTEAAFIDMFGDPTTNSKGWETAPLGMVAQTTSGGTPSRDVAEYYGGRIPWVKSGELHSETVVTTEEFLTERGVSESSAKVMPIGTVLVAMYGATAGAVATLGIEAATNQAICCIQPTQKIVAVYLVHLLRRLAPVLLARRVGGAQPNLSQSLLRAVQIMVPPMEIQHTFAHSVAAVERVMVAQRTSLAEMDALFASLQQRAFRGEL